MEESEQGGGGFKYWAFISYSSKDREVAIRLHKRLEGYAIPRDLRGRPGRDGVEVPPKIFPVFRDRDELPLSSDLGGTIQGALQASRYLIVLCSPNAARSQWVNEEVLHFKRLGREDRILAVILDGEPGAAEMAGREEEECFPHALKYEMGREGELTEKRSEPIGGDLRKGGDGWERVFLKAIAGITGLGFDAFVRRQRKRKRRKQAVMGLVCLLGIAAGIWAWDFNRLKVSWYAHAEEQRGVPVGIWPLGEEEVSHRDHNLRFEERRGKVRRVLDVDGFGNAVPSERFGMIEAAWLEVVYSEGGVVSEHRLFRRDGREVLRRAYSEDGLVVEFKDPSGNAAQAVSGAVGSLTQRGWGVLDAGGDREKKTEITRWVLQYDERGFMREQRFQNSWGAPRPNAEGVFGVRFVRDERGMILREQTLGEDGQPSAGRNGLVVEVRNEYGVLCRPERMTFHDAEGNLVRSPGGHVEERSEFDEWGRDTVKEFLGPDGELVRRPSGFARVEATYGEHGEVLSQAYFGSDRQPILYGGEGQHRWVSEYDEKGYEVARSFYGVKGEPVVSTQGHARMTMVNDEYGRVTSYRYWGLEGEPVTFGDAGNHGVDAKFDERGNVVESTYWGLQDEPIILSNGWHKVRTVFDQSNREVEFRYFGVKGEPVLDVSGVHKSVTIYDERGNVAKVRYFGVKEEKVLGAEGYHEYRMKHDGRGNETGWSYHGVEGEPVVPKGSVLHRIEAEFDEAGMERQRTYWGPDDAATVDEVGVHRRTYRHDAQGRQVERRAFGVDGAAVIDKKEGDHRMTTVYDETGNTLQVASWGVSDEAVMNAEGYHRRDLSWDSEGNKRTEGYFGADEKPVMRQGWGVHRLTFEYDLFGQELTQRCYGVDGKPVVSALGYHLLRNEYDGGGRLASFSYHGVDEQPMEAEAGIHRISRKFDERGNVVEWAYFDKEGKPTNYAGEGYHRLVYELDLKGRELWARYYGVRGEPVMYVGNDESSGGFHARERVLDAEGRALEIKFYGVKGEPIFNEAQGCHLFKRVYDGRGLVLEELYFGVDGKPMVRPGRGHWLKQKFDDRGNVVSERYFGVDGQAVLWGDAPCHTERTAYDRNGRKSEVRYFGLKDEPVENENGWHMIRWQYDAYGQTAELSFFDAKDAAAVHPTRGYHRMTRKNSPMGQVLEEVYWDAAGERVADEKGKSKTVWAFDGAGRLTFHAFYGVDDEPVEIDGVARREGSYDAETGALLEVRMFDAAGGRVGE